MLLSKVCHDTSILFTYLWTVKLDNMQVPTSGYADSNPVYPSFTKESEVLLSVIFLPYQNMLTITLGMNEDPLKSNWHHSCCVKSKCLSDIFEKPHDFFLIQSMHSIDLSVLGHFDEITFEHFGFTLSIFMAKKLSLELSGIVRSSMSCIPVIS